VKNRELAIGVALTAVIGAGAIALASFLAPAQDHAVELAPKDSFFYTNAFLEPSTSQRMAIRDLLEKFPDGGTPEEAEAALDAFLDDLLETEGFTWTGDVKPWLGNQIAVFLKAPDPVAGTTNGAALIATEDQDASAAFMEKARTLSDNPEPPQDKSYEGVDYKLQAVEDTAYGHIENFMVIGTEAGFKDAVDASKGESLADSERFDAALEPLPEDHVALFYFDAKPLFDSFGAALPPGFAQSNPLFQASSSSIAAVVYARSDGIVTDVAGALPAGALGDLATNSTSGLLPELPGDAWAAVGAGDVGTAIQKLYDSLGTMGMSGLISGQVKQETGIDLERDVISWMGDLGIFVRGTSPNEVEGALVIETSDEKTAGETLLKLRAYFQRQGAPIRPDTVDASLGFAIQERSMPQPINLVVGNKRVVIAYGSRATASALSTSSPLSSDAGFNRAVDSLGDGFVPGGYLDIQAIITLVESSFAFESTGLEQYNSNVKPNLEPLTHVIFGSKRDGDRVVQRIVVGVE
jgi:Protein of unknown function (DUF3352)